MSGKCSYLEDVERLNASAQGVLFIIMGGIIACPRCSRPGNVIYHNFKPMEEDTHEKMDQA